MHIYSGADRVERHYANFTYQTKSWSKPRRVVARVEWYPGGLFPRAGFVVTTLPVPDERVFEFYNRRGTAEQYIKQGKYALKWTRLSCQSFKANQVRLQLHALACNMANFLRTLVLPASIADRSLTSLRDRMIKVGVKAVRPARSIILQLAEVSVPKDFWAHQGPLGADAGNDHRPEGKGPGTVIADIIRHHFDCTPVTREGMTMPEASEKQWLFTREASKPWKTDHTSHHASEALDKGGVYVIISMERGPIWQISV